MSLHTPRDIGTTLYVTFDGVLQQLGYSQVARVVGALARGGNPYVLLSLERPADLANAERVDRVRTALSDAGVDWTPLAYAEHGGSRAVVTNVAHATIAALRIARRRRIGLVHARAFHSALVARAVRATLGTPYLFDARAYWVDEQVEEGRRFTTPRAYALAKAVERDLFSRAAGVVTLTDLQAGDFREGHLGRWGGRPVVVIPTCADYAEFRPREAGETAPAELAAFLGGATGPGAGPVLGIVGSLNRSYLGEATASLAASVLRRRPGARLLVLSSQREAYRALLERAGAPTDATLVREVGHGDVARWMRHIDWGLLLLRENAAKRASVPTKLAEFFAAGVRPVQIGCNPEVSEWVRRAGSGLVLPGTSDSDLERAAAHIVENERAASELVQARTATQPHFGLESGVARYAEIVRRLHDAKA